MAYQKWLCMKNYHISQGLDDLSKNQCFSLFESSSARQTPPQNNQNTFRI